MEKLSKQKVYILKSYEIYSWQVFYLNSLRASKKQFTLGLVYFARKISWLATSTEIPQLKKKIVSAWNEM